MKKLAARLWRNQIVQNAAALYAVQISRKVAPLILIPYLARTLGLAGWGTVAFAQSLGEFIVLIIEFGFNLSATREIARNRESKQRCGEIMAGVLGAQIALALTAIGAAVIASRWIPLLHDNPRLLMAGLSYALAQGFMPLWFYQGLERMRLAAGLEITGKLLGLGAILIWVRSPEDGWLALLIQGLAPAISTAVGIAMAYRTIPVCAPTLSLIGEAFRLGWPMFVFRSGESLYGVGNVFVLGLFAPPAVVAYFASAEKISKSIFGLLNPIREALYPRLSSLARRASQDAVGLARTGVVVMVTLGVALGATTFVLAPLLVRILMGPGFAPAVTVLRILAALPPILSVTYSVGLQWLLPLGRDGAVNRIILTAGALNVALALVLAPHFAHLGMAAAVVSAEAFVCFSMVRVVVRSTPLFRNSAFEAALPEWTQ
jgi:polysaccharide transporter, PST family